MANLKDTIVLGNLTVTGSVNASSILSSGGNAFNTIIVPNQSQLTIDYNNAGEDKFLMYLDNGTVTLQATDGGGNSGTLQFVNSGVYSSYFFADSIHKFGHVGDLQIGSSTENLILGAGNIKVGSSLLPNGTSINLGGSSNSWNNLYLSSSIIKGSYTLTLPSKTGTIALTSDCKNPTDYYWANVKVSSTSSETSNPTFGYIYVHNYIQADIIVPKEQSEVMYIGSEDGSTWAPVLLELGAHEVISLYCLSQNSEIRTNTGIIKPVHLHTELGSTDNAFLSGTMSLLRTNSITSLDKPTRIYMSIESDGICLPGNDEYGRIYPGAGNCGYIGTSSKYFWYMYTNNFYATSIYPRGGNKTGTVGSTSSYFNYGYFQNLYKAGASVSTSDIRLKNNIVKTDLQALDIVTKLNVLNYQLNDFTDDQQKLKRQKKKALEKMKQIPKTKETREVRKQLQQIISTPNQSGVQDIGISAQELESLLPQKYRATFVLKEATHNYSDQRFIKDENLVYLLLKAIQEQQEQIVELQNKVQSLL